MPCTGWIVNGVKYPPDKPPQWVVDHLIAVATKMAKQNDATPPKEEEKNGQ